MKKGGKNEPLSTIRGLANWWFNLVLLGSTSLMAGVVAFTYFYTLRAGLNYNVYIYLSAAFVIELVFLIWLNGVKNRAPEKLLGILRYIRGIQE